MRQLKEKTTATEKKRKTWEGKYKYKVNNKS